MRNVEDPEHLHAKVQQRGHYRFVVRPLPFKADRFKRSDDLKEALLKTEVRIQGWSFPPVVRDLLVAADGFIHAGVSFEGFNEYYRLYDSGQFAYLRGFFEDWMDERRPMNPPWPGGRRIWVEGMLGAFVGAHRFARNLGELTKARDVQLDVSMIGINDRHLEHSRAFGGGWVRGDPTTPTKKWSKSWTYSTEQLMANADDLGWDVFVHACDMLGYDLPGKYPHEWAGTRAKLR